MLQSDKKGCAFCTPNHLPAPMSDAAPPGAAGEAGPAPGPPRGAGGRGPLCVLMIGMAGSGKTSLVQRLNAELRAAGREPYLVNLDPAVMHLPFGPHVDIRDTVNYKEVMRQYGLGPNGAIVTSLNLFATRFDQVATIIQRRIDEAAAARRGSLEDETDGLDRADSDRCGLLHAPDGGAESEVVAAGQSEAERQADGQRAVHEASTRKVCWPTRIRSPRASSVDSQSLSQVPLELPLSMR